MKLAEALALRADCQKKIESLKQRLVRNARVQDGEAPSETPQVLMDEVDRTSTVLSDLIRLINKTNSQTELAAGKTLSDALAERDVLMLRRRVYQELATAASVVQDRYSRSEVKFKSTINVIEIQNQADQLAKEYRELDSRIQEANWKTDLLG